MKNCFNKQNKTNIKDKKESLGSKTFRTLEEGLSYAHLSDDLGDMSDEKVIGYLRILENIKITAKKLSKIIQEYEKEQEG